MGWTEHCASKIVRVDEAAKAIASGENVYVGMMSNMPQDFAPALIARASELRGVRIFHYLSMFPWAEHAPTSALQHVTIFATPFDRSSIADGRTDYLPLGSWCEEHLARDHPAIDTAVVTLSPPDADGYMSFGSCLWLNGFFARNAKRVFAEIDENAIRTAGDNRIHISLVDKMWMRRTKSGTAQPRPLDPQAEPLSETICNYVAKNILRDGDCIQIGTGDVSAQLASYLGHLNDIGVQTELLPTNVLQMMDRGVITGKFKQVAPGKVIASAVIGPEEEVRRVHMHKDIELWDFTRTDDIRTLSQISNFKSINNAMQIDLGGQITAESVGSRIYSGPGGQTAFAIAASYSNGGAAITVLPSFSMVKGVRRSRIVPQLTLGASVTVPRTHVDYVVTEYGAAKISGMTLRERAEALIAIAHPECRDELRDTARAWLKLAS